MLVENYSNSRRVSPVDFLAIFLFATLSKRRIFKLRLKFGELSFFKDRYFCKFKGSDESSGKLRIPSRPFGSDQV